MLSIFVENLILGLRMVWLSLAVVYLLLILRSFIFLHFFEQFFLTLRFLPLLFGLAQPITFLRLQALRLRHFLCSLLLNGIHKLLQTLFLPLPMVVAVADT